MTSPGAAKLLEGIRQRLGLRRFTLERDGATIAEGVQFSNGDVALKETWFGPDLPGLTTVGSQWTSTVDRAAIDHVLDAHQGARVVWVERAQRPPAPTAREATPDA